MRYLSFLCIVLYVNKRAILLVFGSSRKSVQEKDLFEVKKGFVSTMCAIQEFFIKKFSTKEFINGKKGFAQVLWNNVHAFSKLTSKKI